MLMKSASSDLYISLKPRGQDERLEVAKRIVSDLILDSTQWFCEDPATEEESWVRITQSRMEAVAAHAGTKSAYLTNDWNDKDIEEFATISKRRAEYRDDNIYLEVGFSAFKPTDYNVVDVYNVRSDDSGYIIARDEVAAYVRKNGPTVALGLKNQAVYARKSGVFPKDPDIVWKSLDDNEALVYVDAERGARMLKSRKKSQSSTAQKRLITYNEIDAINSNIANKLGVKYTPRRYWEFPRWIKVAEACFGKREANRILKDFVDRWNLNEVKNQEKIDHLWEKRDDDQTLLYKRLSTS